MAQALDPVSAQLVDAGRVSRGDRVVDVATGTGNAALRAAQTGASVVGVDFEPTLLARAAERAHLAGLEVSFIEGDAEALPVASEEADVVLSAFGVMYALDHAAAARELVRVLAPRGRIALASWLPESFMPAMGAVIAPYIAPPPPASSPPARWGDPDYLRRVLGEAGAKLHETHPDQLTLSFEHAEAAADFLIRTAGHIVSVRGRLEASGRWASLREDLVTFVEQNAEPLASGIALGLGHLVAVAGRD
jgi:SAM-dependent methyltransferase